jgi:hypothetical protein
MKLKSLWRILDEALQDARFAFRALRKAPIFALTAILPLALAIASNTAIFSILDTLILQELPVPAPSHSVAMHSADPRYGSGALSYEQIEKLNSLKSTFQSVSGWMLPP